MFLSYILTGIMVLALLIAALYVAWFFDDFITKERDK